VSVRCFKTHVSSLKNSASLNFLYREHINNHFSIIFAKKQINSKRLCQFVKKFCLFEFFVSRTATTKPLLDNILKKINSKRLCQFVEKFCLFEFFESRTSTIKPVCSSENSASLNFCIENLNNKTASR